MVSLTRCGQRLLHRMVILGFTLTACQTPTAVPELTLPSAPLAGKLAFTSDQTGNRDIYVMALGKAAPVKVTHTLWDEHEIAWSPMGERIAYGAKNQVWVVMEDGQDQLQLTRTPGVWEAFSPSWSPDGSRLAFASHGSIWITPLLVTHEGHGWRQLTPKQIDLAPAWSPTGDRIAFVSVQNQNSDIYTMRPDGSDIRQMTTHIASDDSPAWSPDGNQIAFVSERDGDAEIYVMRADGTNIVQITNNAATDTQPTWSADGSHIAFATNRAGNWDIYVVRSDGTDERPLIHSAANEEYPVIAP